MNVQQRYRLTVTGIVQGVGFRPFVYGLAMKHNLTGFVGNNSSGVFIEIEGTAENLTRFQHTLHNQPPPLAHIEAITSTELPPIGDTTFTIVHSLAQPTAHTHISPDMALCDDCLQELFDPQNRRYHYPFINCTNCGPRFTIIQDIPYDRPFTTMSAFPLCPACQAEYDNPLDRRFHAQPNACPVCGPHVWLETVGSTQYSVLSGQRAVNSEQWTVNSGEYPISNIQYPIPTTQSLLAAGKTVAVKGIGGFHLACDATNNAAVALLRQRKGRVDKPFAVMALDVAMVRQFAELSPAEETLLTSKERPILLLHKKTNNTLSNLVAPNNQYVGVMLPYTPLHYLLLTPDPSLHAPHSSLLLIMTSANYSNEPIVKDNDEARQRLVTLADALLLHNRDIYGRCDDSVLRLPQSPLSNTHHPIPLRRSRGYTPFPVKLPFAVPPTLAVGGELKATFCLAQGTDAYMSQHIGDMENLETLQAFETAVNHFQTIFRIQPEIVACDMHPNYLSTRWAQAQGLPVVAVQHHHAHIASLMAEHRLDGTQPVIGFSFDGTGYGTDGAIWGGEVLLADYKGFQRLAHLNYVPLAGGDVAVKRPYRLALTYLWAAGIEWDSRLPPVAACPVAEQKVLRRQLETGLNTVPTSSMGRLFDGVAALMGGRQVVTYEGQAAMELEAMAAAGVGEWYEFEWKREEGGGRSEERGAIRIETAGVVRGIVADLRVGVETAVIAAKFHLSIANLVTNVSLWARQELGFNQVALSGGVFQNVRLLETAVSQLQTHHFDVLTHRQVPANDGGLALGQAVIASRG